MIYYNCKSLVTLTCNSNEMNIKCYNSVYGWTDLLLLDLTIKGGNSSISVTACLIASSCLNAGNAYFLALGAFSVAISFNIFLGGAL